MLSIFGPSSRYCDGITRRGFLKIGALTFGAANLTLADIYRAEATPALASNSHKAVINIFLGGGPPHQDLWDIKTEAPREIRGEFSPIQTNVNGIQICEVFQRMARHMDKCVVIRSIVGCADRHDAIQCLTGWNHDSLRTIGGRPSIGSVLARVQGPADPSVPPNVGLAAMTQHRPWQHRPWSDPGQAGFLGSAYAAFKPEGQGMADMRLNGITVERLGEREALMRSFDNMRRDLDTSGAVDGMDAAQRRALGVLTSSRLLDALDISREPQRTRDRYGDGRPYQYQFDGAPTVNDQLLTARRLVEAGVRCVTLSYGRWDSHGQNFALVRDHGGKLDQCLSALVEDLDARGMLDDVTILVWGEFGRTPRINGGAGRDHWAPVSCCLMIGGGMRTGLVIGATDRLGGQAAQRPVYHGEVLATTYRNLGLNPDTINIIDPTGRPQHLVGHAPLREVM
jgi:hypothetical protein